MPIYEYSCRDCQQQFELLLRNQEQQPQCPDCGGRNLHKEFSVPAAHTAASRSLPMCGPLPSAGGCGLPQCGQGRCAME